MRRAREFLGWLAAFVLVAGFLACLILAVASIGREPKCPFGFFLGRER
jgi:hypothetical protein